MSDTEFVETPRGYRVMRGRHVLGEIRKSRNGLWYVKGHPEAPMTKREALAAIWAEVKV